MTISESGPKRQAVTLYRCGCEHCDAAEQTLQRLTRRLKATFEVRRVESDESLKGLAGWRTPVVCLNGKEISHFTLNAKKWEQAIVSGEAPETEVQGEVVDLECYLASQAHGDTHKPCAEACIAAGEPIGLLAPGDRLYLLVRDRQAPAAYESLRGMAAEYVRVRGDLCMGGGVQGIVVRSAERDR